MSDQINNSLSDIPVDRRYDVIVVGAGHAGCEAALAAARMGRRTLLLTMNLDSVALMPCNPSIGGPAKGHLVREIDALGGEMGRNTDRTFIQIRMLNTGKGPAVQALRAQCDKQAYRLTMKYALERQPSLELKQATVSELLVERDADGRPRDRRRRLPAQRRASSARSGDPDHRHLHQWAARSSASGHQPGGRAGEAPALGISDEPARARLDGWGASRPARRRASTRAPIDFAQTEPAARQPDAALLLASMRRTRACAAAAGPAESGLPAARRGADGLASATALLSGPHHRRARTTIIRDNLHRSPMYNGIIEGIGPRYCPSIEDKVVRFADKERHQIFLEPEGWRTSEVYVQGMNTSLPEDVQLAMLRSIPALERVEMMRVGYAVEYDYVPSDQLAPDAGDEARARASSWPGRSTAPPATRRRRRRA